MLVIDHEPLAVALSRLLADHHVMTASDLRAGMSLLASGKRFDVILWDLSMPEVDALDTFEDLRAEYPSEADRIVFTVASVRPPSVDAFLATVPNLCLEKPLDIEGIRALIERRIRGDARLHTA